MMTRPILALSVCLGVLPGCYEGHEAPAPPVVADSLAIVAGPLQCDGCATLDFEIAGPELDKAETARFLAHDGTRSELAATIELRRFTTDSGLILQAKVTFAATAPSGEYDLELVFFRSGSGTSRRIIGRALRVLTVRTPAPPPTGSTPPPTDSTTSPPPQPPPPAIAGTVAVTVHVNGTEAPAKWFVYVEGGSSYVWDGAVFEVSAAGTRQALPAGQYQMSLADLPLNCAWAQSPRTVVVVQDSTSDVSFDASCGPPAYLDVAVTFTGAPPASSATVQCRTGRCELGFFFGDATRRLQASPGSHELALSVPNNCSVTGPAMVTVTAVPGIATAVAFQVSCTITTGELRVSLRVTGAAPNDTMSVVAGYPGCAPYDCDAYGTPTPEAPSVFRLLPGQYEVTPYRVPSNCAVTAITPALVTVALAATTEAVVDLACD